MTERDVAEAGPPAAPASPAQLVVDDVERCLAGAEVSYYAEQVGMLA